MKAIGARNKVSRKPIPKKIREKVTKFKKKWFKQTKIDVQKQIELEFESTKNELLKEFDYLKDDE